MRFDRAILKDDRRDSLRFILVEKPEHVCSDHRPVRFNTSDRNEITSEWLVKKIMQFSRNSFISISHRLFSKLRFHGTGKRLRAIIIKGTG